MPISKNIIPLATLFGTFILGAVGTSVVSSIVNPYTSQSYLIETDDEFFQRIGTNTSYAVGSAVCRGSDSQFWGRRAESENRRTENYKIISKPRALYTNEARVRYIEGNVRLKVELRSDGTIGNIRPIMELPYGLTEQAVAAAAKIRFTPRRINDRPVSAIVTVDYSFNIY